MSEDNITVATGAIFILVALFLVKGCVLEGRKINREHVVIMEKLKIESEEGWRVKELKGH